MKRRTLSKLVIFLVFNMVLAITILFSYFFKDEKKVSAPPVANKPAQQALPRAYQAIPLVSRSTPQVVSTPVKQTVAVDNKPADDSSLNKVCVEMGPFTLDEKSKMDFILNKHNQANLAYSEKRSIHQLYWNLGRDKSDAHEMFKKQKDGAMSDPKFVLVQNSDKNWVVNIVQIQGSDVMAEKLTQDLAEKAKKINTGGTWEHTKLPEGYFFRFEDFNLLRKPAVDSIEVTLKPSKEPC